MAFWFTMILWAVTFTLSQILTPDPELEDAIPRTIDDFNFPTATEGRVVPLSWGTDRLKGPNVIWYGGLRIEKLEEKVQVNLFKKEKVTIGFRYYVGMQLAICHGPAILKAIWVGDEKIWEGTQSTDGPIELTIGAPVRAAGSGIGSLIEYAPSGIFYFHTGSKTQAKDTYLNQHQSPCPAYRGLCYGVWQGGFVGDSPSVKPWSFEIERIPTGLGGSDEVINGADCNPMHMAYEILTDPSWGYGYPASDVDVTDLQTQAATLKSEGNGISLFLTNQKNATAMLQEIEKQTDGHFRIDPATGKWKCVLVRDGYSLVGLKEANVSNVKEVIEYTRGSWEGTLNIVRVAYKRRANDYVEGFAPAQDSANMQVQGRRVPGTFSYVGVRDDALANKIAWREIRARSYPFAKVRMKVDRTFWDSFVGEVILLTWVFENFSVQDLPFRIIRIDLGDSETPEIMVDAVQDVFSWTAASFADSDSTSWELPVTNLIPFPATDQLGFESPYAFQRRDEDTSEGRIWLAGVSPGRAEAGYEVFQRNASGTPTGDYVSAGIIGGFMQDGELDGSIDNDDVTIDVLTDLAFTKILTASNTEVGEYLYNLFLVGEEMIACTGATEITGGLRLTGCLRGFCDTAQANHSDQDKVYFLGTGGELTTTVFDPTYNVDLKLLPFSSVGNKVADDDAGITVLAIDLDTRARKPYPPTFIDWNSSQYPATVDITSDVVVDFNRRDYRILNEYSQHHVDAATINGDFPANNDTKYRLYLYDGASVVYTGDWNAGAATLTMEFVKILRYLDGLPTTLKMGVHTKHTYSAVDYEADQDVVWSASVTASVYDNDFWLGVLSPSTPSNVWTAPDTGTYAFTIGSSIAGDVEARINGGSWVQVIASGNTNGNLAGVTASDTIEVQHLDSASSDEVLLTIDSPSSSEDALGVIVFA